ncbi:hypothetical protein GCM10020000_49680 [Streptomyces olivoverticillatus]
MDIVVKGRKTEVPERFRKHVAEKLKLDKVQKLDGKVISLDVEVSKEPNPRQSDRSDRVEITVRSRGPVIRAEAAATDPYAALDLAAAKLEARLRKQHDKRHTRRGNGRIPASGVAVTVGAAELNDSGQLTTEQSSGGVPVTHIGPLEVRGEGPLVVREKTHTAAPHDTRPGPLRDGVGRSRLLPVRRLRYQAAQCRLPAARVRLRRHPPQRRPALRGGARWCRRGARRLSPQGEPRSHP